MASMCYMCTMMCPVNKLYPRSQLVLCGLEQGQYTCSDLVTSNNNLQDRYMNKQPLFVVFVLFSLFSFVLFCFACNSSLHHWIQLVRACLGQNGFVQHDLTLVIPSGHDISVFLQGNLIQHIVHPKHAYRHLPA